VAIFSNFKIKIRFGKRKENKQGIYDRTFFFRIFLQNGENPPQKITKLTVLLFRKYSHAQNQML
jgi:hypothetical protein